MEPMYRRYDGQELHQCDYSTNDDYYDHDKEDEEEEDEIELREIEAALLQRIHYSEDCLEPKKEELQQSSSDFSSIKLVNLSPERGPKIGAIKENCKNGLIKEEREIGAIKKDREIGVIKEDREIGVIKQKCEIAVIKKDQDILQDHSGEKSTDESQLKLNTDSDCQIVEDDYRDSKYKTLIKKSETVNVESEIIIITDSSESDVEIVSSASEVICIDVSDTQSSSVEQSMSPAPSRSAKRKWLPSQKDPTSSSRIAEPMPFKKVKINRDTVGTASVGTASVRKPRLLDDADMRDVVNFFASSSSEDESVEITAVEPPNECCDLSVHYTSMSGRMRTDRYHEFKVSEKVITCVLCGTSGHTDQQCPNALCYICELPGHRARDCPNKKLRYISCHRCFMKGHTEKSCPDRWRQFHLTTEVGSIIKYKKKDDELLANNGKVYCYNCSRQGHFGHECWGATMNSYAPLILPTVMKYDKITKKNKPSSINPIGNRSAKPVKRGKPSAKAVKAGKRSTKLARTGECSTKPVKTGKRSAKPVKTGKRSAKAVKTDKSTSKPVKTDKSTSKPVKTDKSTSKPVKTDKSTSKPVKTDKPCSKPVKADKPCSKPVKTDKSSSKPVKADKPCSKPVKTDKSTSKPVKSGKHSTKSVKTGKLAAKTATKKLKKKKAAAGGTAGSMEECRKKSKIKKEKEAEKKIVNSKKRKKNCKEEQPDALPKKKKKKKPSKKKRGAVLNNVEDSKDYLMKGCHVFSQTFIVKQEDVTMVTSTKKTKKLKKAKRQRRLDGQRQQPDTMVALQQQVIFRPTLELLAPKPGRQFKEATSFPRNIYPPVEADDAISRKTGKSTAKKKKKCRKTREDGFAALQPQKQRPMLRHLKKKRLEKRLSKQ